MIVRESPKRGEQKPAAEWPPKSPHEALLSSPSGRRKYERRLAERNVSPSPVKRRPMSRAQSDVDMMGEDDDEDEETLQLKLAQIEARLKLKKLQKSREAAQSRPETAVEVPRSPVRNLRVEEERKVPARVLLGIDKGLKADQVSLKPPPSWKPRGSNTPKPGVSGSTSGRPSEPPKGKSFSQRIAESRSQDREREDKQARITNSRSTGFGLAQKGAASSNPSSTSRNAPPAPPKSATATKYAEIAQRDNSNEAASFEALSGLHLKTRNMAHNNLTRVLEGKTVLTIPQLLKTVKAPEYDPPDMENDYVVLGVICHKSNPKTPQNARENRAHGNQSVDANQTGKFMTMRLTDLKYEVGLFLFDTGFSQFWKLPLGTLVAVLNPDIMRPRQQDNGKFSLKLSSSDDTVLEIGTSRDLDFCHARKSDGTDCTNWIDGRKTEYCDYHISLHVERSKRGRMEVNTMSAAGFGKPNGGRSGMFGGGGRGGGFNSGQLKKENPGVIHDAFLHETMYITPGAGAAARLLDSDESGFERGASRAERHRRQLAEKEQERELAKKLGALGQGTGAEYMRAKGTTDQNLHSRSDTATQRASAEQVSSLPVDALGLLSRKADDVSLAPVKRKRDASGKSTTSSEPVGWGGAFKRGLLSPKKKAEPPASSLSRVREPSPTKKKARLLLPEKGIREPGRDSLGTMDVGLLAAMDDDDDDLEFI